MSQETDTGEKIPIFVMGKRYMVPASLTIQKAMEYAGYQLVRGCGCRGGICGACATVYRFPDSHKIEVGLACQTVVQKDMYLTVLPFYPANRKTYDVAKEEPTGDVLGAIYPEIFRCVACGACTKACPMDIEVMDYVAAAIRGDIEKCARLSFDCVMCGLCASRCMAEIGQYHVAILARRLYGARLAPRCEHLATRVAEVAEGKYEEMIGELMGADEDTLKTLYTERQQEPAMAPEDWMPDDRTHL